MQIFLHFFLKILIIVNKILKKIIYFRQTQRKRKGAHQWLAVALTLGDLTSPSGPRHAKRSLRDAKITPCGCW